MIEPKELYRKLDSLLGRTKTVRTGSEYLISIVKELGEVFNSDLHIGEGRVYVKNGEYFTLISPLSSFEKIKIEEQLPITSSLIQSVLSSNTFIYNGIDDELVKNYDKKNNYAIPVAISVNNQDHNWILFFELKSGWVREEIEFCINAVRSVLNYRLLSESIKNEYEQAYLIQKSLLPTYTLEIKGYEISGESRQAESVGGDIFDYYKFNEDEFGVCIGDASGHGMAAALVARDAIIGLRMGIENQTKMIHTLKKLNRVIYQSVYSLKFLSLFYAEIEMDGTLFYVNAGHPHPIMVYNNQITELESTGIVFGILPEIDLRRSFLKLLPGSILVLYTDGIIERHNTKGIEYGIERLKKLILTNQNKTPDELIKLIFLSVQNYGEDKEWADDATIVVIKRLI